MPRQSTTIIPVGLESLYKSTTRKMEWSMGRFKKTTLAGGTTSVSSGHCDQENMSMLCIPPYTPLLCRKTGACRGICLIFLFLIQKEYIVFTR